MSKQTQMPQAFELAKEKLRSWFDDSGKFVLKNDALVEVLKLGAKELWKERMSFEDFNNLLDQMTWTDKVLLEAAKPIGREQYEQLLSDSNMKKDVDDDKIISEAQMRKVERKKLLDQVSWISKSKETLSSWASEDMKANMKKMQEWMRKENRLSDADREALEWLPLSMRQEAGVDIIKLDGFAEFSSTTKAKTNYSDMDKDGVRSIDHLKDSPKFRAFVDTIAWCDMMSLDRTYQLMNIVAKQLGITDTIDQNYLNTVYEKYWNSNLPLNNDLWRILRALYVISGDQFVIPILVNGKVVRSVFGIYDGAWIVDNDDGYDYFVRPFSEIASSPSA